MNLGNDDDRRIAERAAQYLGALTEGDTARDALFAWLKESPRHVEELLFVLRSAQDIASVTPEQEARIEAMAGGAHEADVLSMQTDANVVHLDSSRTPAAHPALLRMTAKTRGIRAARWGAGVAAVLAIVALVVWQLPGVGSGQTYATAIGEQRSIKLADGSMVYLNTRSRLDVRFTDTERVVRLREGEALFTVEQDPLRPFSVHSDRAVIQAIGTQFGVYRYGTGTRVAVLEGIVQISPESTSSNTAGSATAIPPRLSAGEEANIASDGKIIGRRPVDSAKAAAWRQRRLVFEDEPLQAIVEEFNRYNVAPRIRVLDEKAGQQRFSGTFDADAPETMVNTLVGNESLVVMRAGQEIAIRSRD